MELKFQLSGTVNRKKKATTDIRVSRFFLSGAFQN